MIQQEVALNPVHVLSAGPFGRAVARHLHSLRGDLAHTDVADNLVPLPSTWPAARIRVLVTWRPAAGLCELLNQFSYETQRSFIPVMQDLTAIRVGPIVMPGNGPCWHCWITRWRQHSGWVKERMALTQYYSSHPQDGPRGYLEPLAAMAAIRLDEVIAAVDAETAVPGYIWQIDVLTGEINAGIVVGVHDCRWCGLSKPKETRAVAELRQELRDLWWLEGAANKP